MCHGSLAKLLLEKSKLLGELRIGISRGRHFWGRVLNLILKSEAGKSNQESTDKCYTDHGLPPWGGIITLHEKRSALTVAKFPYHQ